MELRKTAAAIAVAITLALPVPAFARQSEPVKATSAGNVKGTQRVTIGQVTIGFLIERKDSAKAGGGLMGSGFGGRSTVRSTLAGYTREDLQQVADAAHDDLVAKLTAAGFQVDDRAQLTAYPAFAAAPAEVGTKEASARTGRDDNAKVLFVSASQTAPLRMMVGDIYSTGFGAMGIMMSGTRVMNAMTAYAKDSGSRIVNVVYYIDFANSEEYGGWFRNSSAVQVNGGLALMPEQSKLTVVGPNYKSATLTLNEPVAVGGDFFDKNDSMGGAEKTSNALGNAIGLLGGVGTNSSKKFTFTARPGAYSAGAAQAVAEANTTMARHLATLR